jgi:hypothetical protein
MIESQEFENEFYEKQIEIMSKRYSEIFKKWNINWNNYYEKISLKLRNNPYCIWIFLCGLENFIKKPSQKEGRRKRLYKDAEYRANYIVKNYFKIREESLNN